MEVMKLQNHNSNVCFLPEAANGVICLLVITLRQTRYQLYLEQLTPKAERHVNPELSWGIHSFYGQPVPAPHHCFREVFPKIQSESPRCNLRPFPLVLSQVTCEKTAS